MTDACLLGERAREHHAEPNGNETGEPVLSRFLLVGLAGLEPATNRL